MSFVVSNQNLYGAYTRDYTDAELETMTTSQFDQLPLADQVSIYNKHRADYDRLTGRTAPKAEETKTDAQRFADEFEQRVDEALRRNFHLNEV